MYDTQGLIYKYRYIIISVILVLTSGKSVHNHRYHIINQLGTYYDMRYMEYITRTRFILGLSKYNEDDSVYEREEANLELSRDLDNNWDILHNWKSQKEEHREKKSDNSSADCTLYHQINEMMNHVLSFVKAPDEGLRAMNEIFFRDMLAFFGPQTTDDSLASVKP